VPSALSPLLTVVADVRNAMDSPAVRRKIEDDELKLKRSINDENLGAGTSIERGNTTFVRGQQQITREAISQQDEALGELGNAVDRLHIVGTAINEELKDHNRLLNELDKDLDDAGEKMNFVMAKLSVLLKTKDGCQIWTIVILAVILIVLGPSPLSPRLTHAISLSLPLVCLWSQWLSRSFSRHWGLRGRPAGLATEQSD
jgi:hypothetical protein